MGAVQETVDHGGVVEGIRGRDQENIDPVVLENLFPGLFTVVKTRVGARNFCPVLAAKALRGRSGSRPDRLQTKHDRGYGPCAMVEANTAEIRGEPAAFYVFYGTKDDIPAKHASSDQGHANGLSVCHGKKVSLLTQFDRRPK